MAGSQIVIITGTFGKKPEISYTPSGTAVCKFSLATSKKIKDEEVTSWHKLTAFGKTGENIEKYHDKGDQIYVEAELSYGKYNKNGTDVYTTDLIVNKFSFIGSKKKNENQGSGYSGSNSGGGFNGPPDDDIPFAMCP